MTINKLSNVQSICFYNQISRLVKTVEYHYSAIEADLYKLNQISNQHTNKVISNKAHGFAKKQHFLFEVADELKTQLNQFKNNQLQALTIFEQKEQLQQLETETDLLSEMHFRLKKTFFSFLNTNIDSVTISQNTIASRLTD